MAIKRLNEKQIKFCKNIAMGLGISQAYQDAFIGAGKGTSAVNANRLLKKPEIKSKIKEFQETNKRIVNKANQKAADKVSEGEIASIQERMVILTKIARGEIPLTKPMVCDGVIEMVPVIPDWMDRNKAIAELNKMDGSYAPTKVEQKNTGEIAITNITRTVISKKV